MAKIKIGTFTINNQSFEIKEGLTFIGRDPVACSIILPNVSISKTHAIILNIENQYYISDLRSTNGTIINEENLIPHTCQKLTSNTKILLGDLLGIFTIQESFFKVPNLPGFKSPKVATIHEMDTQIIDDLPMTQILPNNIHEVETQNADSTINEMETQLIVSNEIDPNINNLETQDPNNSETQMVVSNEASINDLETQMIESPKASNTSNSFMIPETQAEPNSSKQVSINEIDESDFDEMLDITDSQMAKVEIPEAGDELEETQYDAIFEEKTKLVESFGDFDVLESSQDNIMVSKISFKKKDISEAFTSAEISLQASIQVRNEPSKCNESLGSSISIEKSSPKCPEKSNTKLETPGPSKMSESTDDVNITTPNNTSVSNGIDCFDVPTQIITPNKELSGPVLDPRFDEPPQAIAPSTESPSNDDDLFDMPTQIVTNNTSKSCLKSPDVFTMPTPRVTPSKTTRTKLPLPSESDLFEVPTQKIETQNTSKDSEDLFAMPTQMVTPSETTKSSKSPVASTSTSDLFEASTQKIDTQNTSKNSEDLFAMPTQMVTPSETTKSSKLASTSTSELFEASTQKIDTQNTSEDLFAMHTQMVAPSETTKSSTSTSELFEAPTQKIETPSKTSSRIKSSKLNKVSSTSDLFEAQTQKIDQQTRYNSDDDDSFLAPTQKVGFSTPAKLSVPTQKVDAIEVEDLAPTQKVEFSTPAKISTPTQKVDTLEDLAPTQKVHLEDAFDAPTQKVDVFLNETVAVDPNEIVPPKKSRRQAPKNPIVEEFLSSQRKATPKNVKEKKEDLKSTEGRQTKRKQAKRVVEEVKSESRGRKNKKEAVASTSGEVKVSPNNLQEDDDTKSVGSKATKRSATTVRKKASSTMTKPEISKTSQEEDQNLCNVRKSYRKRHMEENVTENPKERKLEKRQSKPPRTVYNVMFTFFRDDAQEAVVNKLGGRVVAETHQANVLVTAEIRRTVKLLTAISRGIPVVSPNWLQVCKRENTFVDPWQHLLIDKNAHKKFGFDLNEVLNRAKEGLLLEGYTVVVTKSLPEDMKDLIENCGGVYLKKVPADGLPEKSFIVSTVEDKAEWPRRKNKTPQIVSAEAIYSSLIRQRLDLRKHMFP